MANSQGGVERYLKDKQNGKQILISTKTDFAVYQIHQNDRKDWKKQTLF
jgi:hypothetical protein